MNKNYENWYSKVNTKITNEREIKENEKKNEYILNEEIINVCETRFPE